MEINNMSQKELDALQQQIEKRKQTIQEENIRQLQEESTKFLNTLRENKDLILSIIDERTYNNNVDRDTTDKSILKDILDNDWNNDYVVRFEVYIDRIE